VNFTMPLAILVWLLVTALLLSLTIRRRAALDP
jgi:hypothetical protein